jgi:hypothetical protein
MRQCFAFIFLRLRLTSNRVRIFERIVKKRTKPQGSNRLERRVPESDELTLYGVSHWRLRLMSPLL